MIAGVEIGGIADQRGVEYGDKITAVDGKKISSYEEVLDKTYYLPLKPINLTIERGAEVLNVNITPDEMSYVDNRGMKKEHGRIAVIARHTPYKISVLKKINNIDVSEHKKSEIKKILFDVMDQEVLLTLKSTDKKNHVYRTIIKKEFNSKLYNEEDYYKFTLGTVGNNFYQRYGITEAVYEAYKQTQLLLISVAKIPFQLFPIDQENLSPKNLVADDGVNWISMIYKFIFLSALLSIIIALINLIPLPFFDGGKIAIILLEESRFLDLSSKQINYVLVTIVMSFYVVSIVLNGENLTRNTLDWIESCSRSSCILLRRRRASDSLVELP